MVLFLILCNSCYCKTVFKLKNKTSFIITLFIDDGVKEVQKYKLKGKNMKKIKIDSTLFKDSILIRLSYKDTVIINKYSKEILSFKNNFIQIGVIQNYIQKKKDFEDDQYKIIEMLYMKDYTYHALRSNLFVSKLNVKDGDSILYFLLMLDDGYRVFLTGAKLN